MLQRNYSRSITRLAIHSRSKTRHAVTNPRISELTRVDTTRSTACADSIRSTKRRSQRRLWPPLHPAHLTKSVPYQTSQGCNLSSGLRVWVGLAVRPGGVFAVVGAVS